MASTADFYAGVDDAPELKTKNWIRPGLYKLTVTDFRPATRQHDGEQFQVIEFDVAGVLKSEEGSHSTGEHVTHMMNLRHKKSLSRIKQFISSVSGLPIDKITAEKCGQIADDNSLIAGLSVVADAYMITTEKGSPFTVVDYRASSDNSEATASPDEEIPF